MELVVDAVVIFSFFKPESYTRSLFKSLYTARAKLYAPDYMMEELLGLRDRITEYSKISVEEFTATYILLSQVIEVVPAAEYASLMPQALKTFPGHEKDAPYFALAAKLGCAIWSNEKRFKAQDKVTVYSTQELKKMFGPSQT